MPIAERRITVQVVTLLGTVRSSRRRTAFWATTLALALVALVIAAIGIGPVGIPPHVILQIIAHKLGGSLPVDDWHRSAETIVWNLRIPRVLLAVGVGSGLALCLSALQAMVRNVLADPYILGLRWSVHGSGWGDPFRLGSRRRRIRPARERVSWRARRGSPRVLHCANRWSRHIVAPSPFGRGGRVRAIGYHEFSHLRVELRGGVAIGHVLASGLVESCALGCGVRNSCSSWPPRSWCSLPKGAGWMQGRWAMRQPPCCTMSHCLHCRTKSSD